MYKRFLSALFIVVIVAISAAAQEVEVDRYTITARIDPTAGAIDARASLAVSNLGQSAKPKLYFRLTKLAKVSAAAVNGASARVETADDRRAPTLNQIIITPQASIAAGGKATVEVSYRIEAMESSALAAIYPGEVLMMPEAVWVPMPSTMFTLYGPTTAPFTLSVTASNNFRVASSGALKSDENSKSFTYDQPFNSIPFFVAGSFDQPATAEHGGVKIEVHAQAGLAASPVAQGAIRRLSDEAGRAIDFLTKLLGPLPPGTTFRIISSARTGNAAVPGAVVFNQQVFRRATLNATTVELLADAVARMWIDGRARVRGQEPRTAQPDRAAQKARSAALIRDSLPRYLAALYVEERFGKQAAREAFNRMRWSYTPIAQSGRDAELGVHTIALATYSAAAFGKGPLVLRLIAETAGREKFIAALKAVFAPSQTKIVTADDLRQALAKEPGVEKLFQQWVDSIIEPDIVIGIPQPSDKPGAQRLNLRNLGTGDVTVTVQATTASGKQVTATVNVPSEEITSTEVQTAEKITSVEVDPEKLIIQSNYDNDAKPAQTSSQTLFNESIVAFNKREYGQAETKLKEAVRLDPDNSLLHAWLARALAAQNKTDEAVAEANAALKIDPPLGSAVAWARITLGQIALARASAAEATEHLRQAVAEADEAPAQFAAREALIKAERAANQLPAVEESIRAFASQLDTLIKQPSSDKLYAVVIRNNLKRFVQGLTVTPPSAWTTEILRVDPMDSNRVAVDVALKVKAGGQDQAGTALFILYRSGSGWMLEDVQLFNVK